MLNKSPGRSQLTYAYVKFEESRSDLGNTEFLTFSIDVNLEEVPAEVDTGRCWRNLIGPAVLVQGYLIPYRQQSDRGLEVQIPIMAAISGTPRAVSFGGGFVFKARSHALVPIKGTESSVQWHVLDSYPQRLVWDEIGKQCPTRLREETVSNGFWCARSFCGWCPRILELLGESRLTTLAARG